MKNLIKNILWMGIFAFLTSCQNNPNSSNEEKKKTNEKESLISRSESDKNIKELYQAIDNINNNEKNDTCLFGFFIGMQEDDCDIYLETLIKKQVLKKSGNKRGEGYFLFPLSNNENIPMDVHAASKGVFKNHPRIIFQTAEHCDDMNKVDEDLNKI